MATGQSSTSLPLKSSLIETEIKEKEKLEFDLLPWHDSVFHVTMIRREQTVALKLSSLQIVKKTKHILCSPVQSCLIGGKKSLNNSLFPIPLLPPREKVSDQQILCT